MSMSEDDFGPSSLYKYCGIHEHSLSSLQQNRIYLASPSQLNDPFDCQLSISPIDSNEDYEILFRRVAQSRGMPPDLLIQHETDREELNVFLETEMKTYLWDARVYCMSENRLNMSLWAYYAESQKGMCIEFERHPGNIFGSSSCKLVDYVPQAQLFVSGSELMSEDPSKTEKAVKRALYTKLDNWKSEEEWRIVRLRSDQDESLPKYLELPSGTIKSITFGPNTCKRDIDLVTNTCKASKITQDGNIPVYRVRVDREEKRLVLEDMEGKRVA